MAELSTAVALLFEDGAMGAQLRAALVERGARIVHEGPPAAFDRAVLQRVGADVVVLNLDGDDDALERLYDIIEGGHPRVVFNDAQASGALEGWARARWARHLAMKVMADGDVDPPRPEDMCLRVSDVTSSPIAGAAVETAPVDTPAPEPPLVDGADAQESASAGSSLDAQADADADELAAELEALLAAESSDDDVFARAAAIQISTDAKLPEELEDLDAMLARVSATEEQPPPPAPPAVSRASDAWSLVDDADPVPAQRRDSVAAFGIEKVDPADFLAPESPASTDAAPLTPGLSLELVSIEEAIAPQAYQPNEMVLEDLHTAISRVVLLGATTESTASVCEFLTALPAGLRAVVLHTQHTAGKPADALAEHLAEHCAMPVRLAQAGVRARNGEVLVVPTGQQVRLLRDGSVELQPTDTQSLHTPSIDISFTLAANTFGRDIIAILFAGQSTDAIGGCQAVHDRGGQVWVETSHEHVADMVGAVMAEHLCQFSGAPRALANRLVEQLSTGTVS